MIFFERLITVANINKQNQKSEEHILDFLIFPTILNIAALSSFDSFVVSEYSLHHHSSCEVTPCFSIHSGCVVFALPTRQIWLLLSYTLSGINQSFILSFIPYRV